MALTAVSLKNDKQAIGYNNIEDQHKISMMIGLYIYLLYLGVVGLYFFTMSLFYIYLFT